MDTLSIFKSIYNNVFCNTFSQTCYVFLCGGANKENIRNQTRAILEKKHLQVLYPEDLFIEMLNRNKKADLLEYENFLAENADIICVICESMGSAVELGAFVQNQKIRDKMVVVINQKFSRDKSFIMMGPVKHIKKEYVDRVVFYKKDELDDLGKKLHKCFRKIHKKTYFNKERSFDKLSAYIAFIPMVVYFYKEIERKQLFHGLKEFLKDLNSLPPQYNELFNVAIKYLLKTGILVTDYCQSKNETVIALSDKGDIEIHGVLSQSIASEKTILHDRIRCAILKEQLNN